MVDKNINLPLVDIKLANENLKSVRTFLDRGFKAGQYSLDDAENILYSVGNLQKVIENLDLYQKYLLMLSKKDIPPQQKPDV